MAKFMSLEDVASLVHDKDTIWISGCGGGINDPDYIFSSLEKRFLLTGHPINLVLCHSAGIGNKQGQGVDRFAHPGMVKKIIGSHWTWSVGLQTMAMNNQVEAYVLPQGVMTALTREIAAHRPGVITRVGLNTFIDPRFEGGKMNKISRDALSEIIKIHNEEYLFYKGFPIKVSIFRASVADEKGNVSFEDEGVMSEALSQAQAAKNSGGIVLCQVQKKIEGRLHPYSVVVPGRLIDAIVICPYQTLSYQIPSDGRITGKILNGSVPDEPFQESLAKQMIAKRTIKELHDGEIVNLGFGLPSLVGSLARKDPRLKHLSFTLEQGVWGGIPLIGDNFGIAYYPDAIVPEASQFDFFDGGGIDTAVLSFAEFDAEGNVNVSKISGRVNGVGGFMDIASSAKRVIFVGTFTTGGLKVRIENSNLRIVKEGAVRKVVRKVSQCSFSGSEALRKKQQVLFITERAVFALTERGIELKELSPGICCEKEVLGEMGFSPLLGTRKQ